MKKLSILFLITIIVFLIGNNKASADTVIYTNGTFIEYCEVIDTTKTDINIRIFNENGSEIMAIPLRLVSEVQKLPREQDKLTFQGYRSKKTDNDGSLFKSYDSKDSTSFHLQSFLSGIGLGVHGIYPAWGISLKIHTQESFTINGIFGAFGELKSYAGKMNFILQDDDYWRTYLYAIGGMWSYEGYRIDDMVYDQFGVLDLDNSEKTTEYVPGFGFGLGMEVGKSFIDEIWNTGAPPLSVNLEVGYGLVNFEEIDYEAKGFVWGLGIYYRIKL